MKKYGVTNFKMYPIFTIKATTIDNFNCMLNTLESFINPIKECYSRNRKIAQYDINNNLIKIYTSKSEILNTLKIKKSALKMCLCGKNKTSSGFIWKYIIERREFNEKL